ncbi:MAG: hypothetical protein LKI98_07310 [Bifidobacterium crudilactis]|jgi:hypothetical protein|nr:hypothetical protein [Bifidobacterium crudilactis]MCI1890228.1 hypothetical protein [Bifidobacterium crudilactis]
MLGFNHRAAFAVSAALFTVSLLGGLAVSSAQAANDTESATVSVTVEPFVSIVVAQGATISTGNTATATGNVTVATNNAAGYQLSVKGTGGTSHEGDLQGQTTGTEYIAAGASTDLTADNLSAGTWGLGSAAATGSDFANKLGAVTGSDKVFKSTSSTAPLPAGDTTSVTYGVNVQNQSPQVYQGSLLWTAITN